MYYITHPLNNSEDARALSHLFAFDENLLLLLQLLNHIERQLENAGYNVRWSKREPLGQRNISHSLAPVDLDPDEIFRVGSILDIVSYITTLVSC